MLIHPECQRIPRREDGQEESWERCSIHRRQYKNGRLIGDEMNELITFHFEGGRATGLEVRGIAEEKILVRDTGKSAPVAGACH